MKGRSKQTTQIREEHYGESTRRIENRERENEGNFLFFFSNHSPHTMYTFLYIGEMSFAPFLSLAFSFST